jgi:hypothetical protein
MLAAKVVFHPECANGQIGTRLRVLGRTTEGDLLFLLNMKQRSSIELVSPSGHSLTVISFTKYIDFISADISPDRELLHVTQRVPNVRCHSFLSMVISIHNPGIVKEFKSDTPIDGIFLENIAQNVYQLLHFVGTRLTHLVISLRKQGISLEKYKGGLHLLNLLFWEFVRSSNSLFAIYQLDRVTCLNEFRFTKGMLSRLVSHQIRLMPTSMLPRSLSLSPIQNVHLPFFRPSSYNLFIGKLKQTICLVQQLYDGDDSACAFSVSLYPEFFSRIIYVPGVKPDVPLCFLGLGSIAIVLAPNNFLCVIEYVSMPPNISVLAKPFAALPCGICCVSAPLSSHIIDLDNAEVFELRLTFKNFRFLGVPITRATWDVMVQICVRQGSSELFSQALALLQDPLTTVNVTRLVFHYWTTWMDGKKPAPGEKSRSRIASSSFSQLRWKSSDQTKLDKPFPHGVFEKLAELDIDFPAADGQPRRSRFKERVKGLVASRQFKSYSLACRHVFQETRHAIQCSRFLRDSFDTWVTSSRPDTFFELVVGTSFQSEAVCTRFPTILCMRQDLEQLSSDLASVPIRKRLSAAGVVSIDDVRLEEPDEYNYWRARFVVTWREDETSSASSVRSSSSMRIHRARSVDVSIDHLDESESMSASQSWFDMSGDRD